MKIITLLLVLLLPGFVSAADSANITRSAGKLVNESSIDLNKTLTSSAVLTTDQGKQRDPAMTIQSSPSQQYRTVNHDIVVEFDIFDAWVEMSGDIDVDGFYHRIKTTFDADVNTAVETVYAKLYVSYEGGPWEQIADTDLYEISYDSVDDTYEVVSELIDGYPPGYYDVLIDLHSFYHQGIVASRIISQDIDGYAISLEDLEHDEIYGEEFYYEEDIIVNHVGVGSFSWVGLILLVLLLFIKLRYFSDRKIKQ